MGDFKIFFEEMSLQILCPFFNWVQSSFVHTQILNPKIKFKEGDLERSEEHY